MFPMAVNPMGRIPGSILLLLLPAVPISAKVALLLQAEIPLNFLPKEDISPVDMNFSFHQIILQTLYSLLLTVLNPPEATRFIQVLSIFPKIVWSGPER